MKVKRTKTIIEVTKKELNALKIVADFLGDLAIEGGIADAFEDMRSYSYSSLYELASGLNDVINFLDSEKQKRYIINIVNEEEN